MLRVGKRVPCASLPVPPSTEDEVSPFTSTATFLLSPDSAVMRIHNTASQYQHAPTPWMIASLSLPPPAKPLLTSFFTHAFPPVPIKVAAEGGEIDKVGVKDHIRLMPQFECDAQPAAISLSLAGIEVLDKGSGAVKMAHSLSRVLYMAAHPTEPIIGFVAKNPKVQERYCHCFQLAKRKRAQQIHKRLRRALQIFALENDSAREQQQEDEKKRKKKKKKQQAANAEGDDAPMSPPNRNDRAKAAKAVKAAKEGKASSKPRSGEKKAKKAKRSGHTDDTEVERAERRERRRARKAAEAADGADAEHRSPPRRRGKARDERPRGGERDAENERRERKKTRQAERDRAIQLEY